MYMPVEEKILAITEGTCKYNSCKKCDGLCNNCAIFSDLEIEGNIKNGIYTPTYTPGRRNIDDNDYEAAILSKQEWHFDD